jgi:hypothetical protein
MPGGEKVQIRLTGKDVFPENIRAGEVAQVLAAVEDMLAAVVLRSHPTLNKEDLVIGLVSVGRGSMTLEFQSHIPEVVLPAFKIVSERIRDNAISALPNATIRALQELGDFARKREGEVDFLLPDNGDRPIATITRDMTIEANALVTGETTIVGQVIRVGGRRPKAMVETLDGRTVFCDINRDLARDLAEKLYQTVGLHGIGQWDPETLELEEFRIQSLTLYGASGAAETIEKISSIYSKYFDEIEDVDGFVSDLRSDE